MSAVRATEAPAVVPAAPEPRVLRLERAVLQAVVVLPVVRWFCRPLVVRGAPPASGGVVFAANHASHADTLVLLRALPRSIRARTKPAAAEDYFFSSRARGFATRLALGAFPFPRRGRVGLARAEAILAAGGNVVLFPEGTRSTTGSIGPFRRGVGLLAGRGWAVVPVSIVGTRDVIAKGGRLPRRASVVVTFGAPVVMPGADPAPATVRIERSVRAGVARETLTRPAPTPTWYDRVRSFARSRAAVALVCAWAAAEAIALPVVPDVAVVVLVLAAPARAPILVAAAVVGTTVGAGLSYALGASAGPGIATSMPLVTDRMAEAARGWLTTEGAAGMVHQPWTGVPSKAFALQASAAAVPLPDFLAATAWHRGLRFATVAGVLLPAPFVLRRWWGSLFAPAVLAGCSLFALGLARVVASWS